MNERLIYTGRDPKSGAEKTVVQVRTSRSYAEDLCAAYNESLSEQARARGLEWFVTPAGELKLGDSAAWSRANAKRNESRNETERARYLRNELGT